MRSDEPTPRTDELYAAINGLVAAMGPGSVWRTHVENDVRRPLLLRIDRLEEALDVLVGEVEIEGDVASALVLARGVLK